MAQQICIGGTTGVARKVKDIYVGDSNGVAKRVIVGYIGDASGKARKFYSLPAIQSVRVELEEFKAGTLSHASGTDIITITSTDIATASSYGTIYRNSNSPRVASTVNKYMGVMLNLKAVLTDGSMVRLDEYALATGSTIGFTAISIKETYGSGGSDSANNDYIFDTQYAAGWSQSPRSVTATRSFATPLPVRSGTWAWGDGPAYGKHSCGLLIETCSTNKDYPSYTGGCRTGFSSISFSCNGSTLPFQSSTW